MATLAVGFQALTQGAPARLPRMLRYRLELNDTLVDEHDVPTVMDCNAKSQVLRLVRQMNRSSGEVGEVLPALANVESRSAGLDAATLQEAHCWGSGGAQDASASPSSIQNPLRVR